MLTLIILAPIFLALFVITRLLRLIFFHHHHHRGWNRSYNGGGWNGPTGWGWNQSGYNRGYGRRGFGGLGSILFLVALDRLFGRRW